MFIQGIWRFFPQKTLFVKSQGNSHCCSSPETTPQSFGTLPPQTVFSAFKLHHDSLRYFSVFPLLVRHRFEFLLLICCHWNLYLYFTHVSNNLMQTKTGSEILPLVRFAFHLIQFLLSALGCFCKTETHFISVCWHTDASVLPFTWFHSELNQHLRKKDSPPVEGKCKWRWSSMSRPHDPK